MMLVNLVRKPCLTVDPTVSVDILGYVKLIMTSSLPRCPSCAKPNKSDGRYCIYCGSIMKPVYCSSCGTVNPEGLPQCIECGNQVPKLSGIHWNPVVTIIQPTSGMTETEAQEIQTETEPSSSVEDSEDKPLRWLRDRIGGKERPSGASD